MVTCKPSCSSRKRLEREFISYCSTCRKHRNRFKTVQADRPAQVINRSRATAVLSLASAAAALRRMAIFLTPAGDVALRPRDTMDISLSFRLVCSSACPCIPSHLHLTLRSVHLQTTYYRQPLAFRFTLQCSAKATSGRKTTKYSKH